ncbi:MAG TPA: beta-ketoacyl synthase N-terminal-like domain-containing protein [Polyangia bacterium]|nr:beta-ketoacyl synthase N-terminal-like domain-containing protein [Polyangia bacterium]
MIRIAVTGAGVVSPIAVGTAAFADALFESRSAIAPARSEHGLELAARVGEFGARAQIAAASLRRMPRLTQMTVVAAKQALAEAQLGYDSTRIGIVGATGLGTIDETLGFTKSYVDGGPQGASPALFPVSVMNAVAGQLALECGLRGVNSTVNHRDHSALSAIGFACDMLALGRAEALVVAGFDELSAPVEHGYVKMGGVSARALKPYDVARDGLVPGEGAVVIVLEREDDARKRGARARAILTARGESSEHRPRVGWGRDAEWPEAARAVAEAVRERGADRVSWIAGGGNGSSLDARELAAVAAGLARRAPASSILGQTGEFFSSAMLRVLATLAAFERQTLPGTVGLERADGAWDADLVRAPRSARVDGVLVPSFAQGGANLALMMERS